MKSFKQFHKSFEFQNPHHPEQIDPEYESGDWALSDPSKPITWKGNMQDVDNAVDRERKKYAPDYKPRYDV